MKALSTILVILASLGVLVYIGKQSIEMHVVPPLQEFIEEGAGSTDDQKIVPTEARSTQAVSDKLQASSTFAISSTENISAPLPASFSLLHTPSSSFRITIAKTPATREKGLSGRVSLAPDEGLLFIFPEPGRYSFWMKDMNFPIDIVWIDSSRKVTGILEDISPETYPISFSPLENVQFVLEVNTGVAKKSGLRVGDTVSF